MPIRRLKSKLTKGFINCHAHIDRFGTVHYFSAEEKRAHLFEKWRIVEKIKRQSSEEDYYYRILQGCLSQMDFGVKKLVSFIDLDPPLDVVIAIASAFIP